MQPNNKIKFMLGVRTTEQGQFQDVYTRHPRLALMQGTLIG